MTEPEVWELGCPSYSGRMFDVYIPGVELMWRDYSDEDTTMLVYIVRDDIALASLKILANQLRYYLGKHTITNDGEKRILKFWYTPVDDS